MLPLRPFLHEGSPRRRGPTPLSLWPSTERHGVGERGGTRRSSSQRGRSRRRSQAQRRCQGPDRLLPCDRGWKNRNKGPLITAIRTPVLTRSQLAHLLETINLALASPPLTDSTLKSSKAYLFLVPAPSNPHREKIVGCVVAQRITTAMAIATREATIPAGVQHGRENSKLSPSRTQSLVAVDTSSGLFCHPTPLPTPLGITRLFVPSAHRRQGIATQLLSAAAATFIHACPLDPTKGQVAFTQPTEGGCAVMEKWGKGFVRIYEE